MLIVLDGLDGSGKSTQFLIIEKILSENFTVKAISFPEYDKPSSALIKMYLNGELSGNVNEINAYAASSFYAVDRYASYKMYWEKNYINGDIILTNRYVSSNAIHQMSKLKEYEWDGFLDWLSDYEYKKLALPIPDVTIYLDMPIDLSQRLLSERYNGNENKKDIHESNIGYLSKCRKSALYACNKLGWNIVPCSDGVNIFPIEKITSEIIDIINNILKRVAK